MWGGVEGYFWGVVSVEFYYDCALLVGSQLCICLCESGRITIVVSRAMLVVILDRKVACWDSW